MQQRDQNISPDIGCDVHVHSAFSAVPCIVAGGENSSSLATLAKARKLGNMQLRYLHNKAAYCSSTFEVSQADLYVRC